MVEYREYRLGSLCKRFSSGKRISSDLIHEIGEYPVIGGNGLRGYTNTYNFVGECAVIGRQGAYCGNVKFFSGKAYMTEHAVVTEPNGDNNAKYLSYKLDGLHLGRLSGQAAQPGLSVTKLARLRIEMPPKEYQDKVVSILSVYDELIETNNKRINTLEQMAENLYKEWFVRFRFPGHKTAEFENGIPKTWDKKKISDIVEFLNGFAFKSEDYDDEGEYIVITIKNVQDGKLDMSSIERICTIPYGMPDYCILSKGDILMSLTGNVGRVCIVSENNCLLNQRVCKIVSQYPYYVFVFFKQEVIFQTLCNIAYGTAQLNLSPILAGKIKVFFPSVGLMKQYNDIVAPFYNEIQRLNEQNQSLVKQRDLLLPRLMSGKLEVQK